MKVKNKLILLSLVSIFLNSCGGEYSYKYIPIANVGDSFDWQLDKVDNNTVFNTKVIDVDAFDTTKEQIKKWHKKGIKVIAYISVGSVDKTRADANLFDPSIIGKTYSSYKDEKFIDIRKIDKLKNIITQRFNMIKSKGFDGIEPDNIDTYLWDLKNQNRTGFNLTQQDSIKYIDYIITQAHNRGLSIGQKNATDLSEKFVNRFDWALLESAFSKHFADQAKIYIDQEKPVFDTEYTDTVTKDRFLKQICPLAKKYKFSTILKDKNLTNFTLRCPDL